MPASTAKAADTLADDSKLSASVSTRPATS
jgi:hypothetical protein